MTEQEIEAAEKAAKRYHLSRSEFARRAINAAAEPLSKTASIRGALRGKITYQEAMKLLRG